MINLRSLGSIAGKFGGAAKGAGGLGAMPKAYMQLRRLVPSATTVEIERAFALAQGVAGRLPSLDDVAIQLMRLVLQRQASGDYASEKASDRT